jgi:hypothetical protein
MNARCEEVLITDLLIRGDGTQKNPYRRIVQVWAKDGTLIAEKDEYQTSAMPPVVVSLDALYDEAEQAYQDKYQVPFQPVDKCASYWREGYVTAKR